MHLAESLKSRSVEYQCIVLYCNTVLERMWRSTLHLLHLLSDCPTTAVIAASGVATPTLDGEWYFISSCAHLCFLLSQYIFFLLICNPASACRGCYFNPARCLWSPGTHLCTPKRVSRYSTVFRNIRCKEGCSQFRPNMTLYKVESTLFKGAKLDW